MRQIPLPAIREAALRFEGRMGDRADTFAIIAPALPIQFFRSNVETNTKGHSD